MKVGYLQNIQSFETSVETGNLQSYEKQSILTAVKVTLPILTAVKVTLPILTAVKVTLQLEQVPSPPPPPPPPLHATVIDYCPDGTITIVTYDFN